GLEDHWPLRPSYCGRATGWPSRQVVRRAEGPAAFLPRKGCRPLAHLGFSPPGGSEGRRPRGLPTAEGLQAAGPHALPAVEGLQAAGPPALPAGEGLRAARPLGLLPAGGFGGPKAPREPFFPRLCGDEVAAEPRKRRSRRPRTSRRGLGRLRLPRVPHKLYRK